MNFLTLNEFLKSETVNTIFKLIIFVVLILWIVIDIILSRKTAKMIKEAGEIYNISQEKLLEKYKQLEEELEKIKNDYEEVISVLDINNKLISELNSAREDLTIRITKLETNTVETSKENMKQYEELSVRIDGLRNDLSNLEVKLNEAYDSIAEYYKIIEDKDTEYDALESECSRNNAEYEEEIQAKEELIKNLEAKVEELSKNIEDVTLTLEDTKKKYKILENDTIGALLDSLMTVKKENEKSKKVSKKTSKKKSLNFAVELEKLGRDELILSAKNLGIKGYTKMTKQSLIEAINKAIDKNNEE